MTWPAPVETSGQLRAAGSVKLSASGTGVIVLGPDNARQRWEVGSVVVSTNQAASATVVPVATVALNTVDITVLSQANNMGQSWSGNQDVFAGKIDVGPADNLTIGFAPAAGQSGASMSGVMAYATVTGTKYTRRA